MELLLVSGGYEDGVTVGKSEGRRSVVVAAAGSKLTVLGLELRVLSLTVHGKLETQNWQIRMEMSMQDFPLLDVWNKAHALTLSVYQSTQAMPREEIFGITMQLRRGATAIATRIAEGCGRESNVEFAVDLRKAVAGCNEVEYLILLAKDLEHLKAETSLQLTEETVLVRKMLFGLLRKM